MRLLKVAGWTRHDLLARYAAATERAMGSEEVVPLSAQGPDGAELRQDGSIRQPKPVTDLPPWLAGAFGAKWQAVGA